MTNKSNKERKSEFKKAIENHDLEDLERILLVNDRKKMDPLFYSVVRKAIASKKRHPLIFIQNNPALVLSIISLMVSIASYLKK